MNWNFSAWSIRNPVPPILLFVCLIALGLYSFSRLPITMMPNIDLPLISVTALAGVPGFVRHAYGEGLLRRATSAAMLDIEAIETQDCFSPPVTMTSFTEAVARLAGVPAGVVRRAEAVLAKLEAGREATGGLAAGLDDLPLFAATLAEAPAAAKDALREALAGIDPDALAPRAALEALYRLKQIVAEEG